MIYYFTGTGNSGYVAKTISNLIGENLKFIPFTDPQNETNEGEDVGFIFPVYSWGVPPIVIDFIKNLTSEFWLGVKGHQNKIWCVMSCGDETALAPEMFENKIFKYSRLKVTGIWSIVMPNNYVLLPGFDVDPKALENEKLDSVPGRIMEIVKGITSNYLGIDVTRGKMAFLKTKVVYPLFKKWGIYTKKWHFLPTCIGCGKCSEACPVGNVKMMDRHPKWGNNCCSCLGCYHICPVHAVAYGKETKKKGQYFFPLKLKKPAF